MEHKIPFKQRVSFEERKAFAEKLRQKKPHFVPVIVEPDETSDAVTLRRDRFFIPEDCVMPDFIITLQDKYVVKDEETPISSICIKVVHGTRRIQPSNDDTILKLYEEHKESDGYLYFVVYREKVFGN